MERYFIKYEDLINNNILNKKIDIYSDNLLIKKRTKNGKYNFECIAILPGYLRDLSLYSRGLDGNSVLMYELTKEEAELYDPIFIKKYNHIKGCTYEEIDIKKEEIELINYNGIKKMSDEDLKEGLILSVLPKKCDANVFLKSNNSDKRIMQVENKNIIKYPVIREDIVKSGIGCDLYFYTKNKDIKSFYINDLVKFETAEDNQVNITKHKLFVIDKITQRDRDNFSISTFYGLDKLIEKSIPIKKVYNEKYYDFKICKLSDEAKIGYLLDEDVLNSLLYTDFIQELFPFVTVYSLENGIYNKMNLSDYLQKKDTVIYVKKANKK